MKLLEDVRDSLIEYWERQLSNVSTTKKQAYEVAYSYELAAITRAEDCVRYSWLAINKSVWRFDWEIGVVDVYNGLPVFTPEQRVQIDRMMEGRGNG